MGGQSQHIMANHENGEVKNVVASEMRVRYLSFGLRFFGLLLTLVASIIVGVDKESKVISVALSDGMPPLHFHATAKYRYESSLVYFLVSNSIACSYASFSLLLSTLIGGRNKSGMALLLIMLDTIIFGLLCTANGAAAGVGILSRDGNSHLHWDKVCSLFDYYCTHMFASLVISILGSLNFLCLVVLASWSLHKKSN